MLRPATSLSFIVSSIGIAPDQRVDWMVEGSGGGGAGGGGEGAREEEEDSMTQASQWQRSARGEVGEDDLLVVLVLCVGVCAVVWCVVYAWASLSEREGRREVDGTKKKTRMTRDDDLLLLLLLLLLPLLLLSW